ncbi:cytochrome p450 [Moniliophthora roreri MCA 2997]|uniref:Cytochrome p450 n=1 Tax=Moniliophthora roreri (strain MCA 2997) TaxID=1381753 RepID=V2Y3J4_MONRO|nr:cytochrome p450 [Moniliophthora roreri MCA 2997]
MALIYVLVLVFFLLYLISAFNKPRYPPGPRKLPFVGNVFQVPNLRQWVQFSKWAKEFGPIFHLAVGPQHIIVLNTPEIVEELFVRRSRVFSNRYAPHVAAEIMSAGQRTIFINGDTDEFRAVKKAFHSAMNATASRRYRTLQDLESRMLLYHISELRREKDANMKMGTCSEHHWYSVVNRLATNVAVMIVYGLRVSEVYGSKKLHAIHQVAETVTHMSLPGAFLADVFPIFRLLPDYLAPWRIRAKQLHDREYGLYGGFLSEIMSDRKKGVDRPDCFVGAYIKERADHGHEVLPGKGVADDGCLRDVFLAYAAGQVLEAASDTTACFMKTYVLFMLAYPEVLKKARIELDSVVGSGRLPGFEDEERLPYLIATIKEVLRCRPPIPLGLPHSPSEDVIFDGYMIPKGSIVIGNVNAMHMDPVRFPEPTRFIPERWFASGKLDTSEPMRWGTGPDQDRDNYVLGWGRRYCPGSHIAEASIFITLSRLIWGLNMYSPTGNSPDPWNEDTYSAGFVTNPHSYDVVFEPRSPEHYAVLQRSFDEGQEQWEILGLAKDEL